MSDHPRNPTLLVGLGAFGRDVLDAAAREPSRRIPNLERIEAQITGGTDSTSPVTGRETKDGTNAGVAGNARSTRHARDTRSARDTRGAKEGKDGKADFARTRVVAPVEVLPSRVLAAARERLRAMLDLEHFVDNTEPTDARGPLCDVFVVADLAEPGMAGMVGPLAAALAGELRAEFHSILRSGDGTLRVCPLLSVPQSAEREAVASAARALHGAAVDADAQRRLEARVYMVEDQSGKYLIARAELVRSFAAFLHLLLFAGLRDDEAGARSLVERTASDPGGPFATFACATLELDHRTLSRLCAVKLAREVLGFLREGSGPTITEIAAEASRLVPERSELELDLWQESSAGTLEKHLEPPSIDVPPIAWEDSPEDIVERKLNALWQARAAGRIRAFREDVERFKMDRLAAEIEKSGKATHERVMGALAERLKVEVESGPRGHARALELLRDALVRAKGRRDEVEAEIESPDLAPFPASPLDAGVRSVHEAAFFRPRRFRMASFGALALVIGAVLIAGVIVGGYRVLAAPDPSFFDLSAPPPEGMLGALLRWPVPLVIGVAVAASSTYYRLWKHYKRHHNWVVEARDSLDQALKGHLCRDAVSYFYRRLHYTRLLWVQRIYRRLVERIEEAIATLEGVRAALAEAEKRLSLEERALSDRIDTEGTRGGILFRSLLSPGGATAVYEEIRPVNLHAMAERFLRESLREEAWTRAPFTDTSALLAFAGKELARLDTLCPFKQESEALFRCASEATRAFLQRLALKLSPPLATSDASSRGRHLMVVPPEAEALLKEILTEENLRGTWDVRAISKDPRRLHLLIDRGEIAVDALRFGRGPAGGSGSTEARAQTSTGRRA